MICKHTSKGIHQVQGQCDWCRKWNKHLFTSTETSWDVVFQKLSKTRSCCKEGMTLSPVATTGCIVNMWYFHRVGILLCLVTLWTKCSTWGLNSLGVPANDKNAAPILTRTFLSWAILQWELSFRIYYNNVSFQKGSNNIKLCVRWYNAVD